jgi:hypothetical protein
MGKTQIHASDIADIRSLRETGHSINEISRQVKCSKSTVQRYIKDVVVHEEYVSVLKDKQRVSVRRSRLMWNQEERKAKSFLNSMSERELIMLMIGLYWGEGTKRELNLINGDPYLVRTFLSGLYALGAKREDVRLSIRVYGKKHIKSSSSFWIAHLGLTPEHIVGYEILENSGETRLIHGMCRVRIQKSQRFFKRIMSMIHLLGTIDTLPR